MRPGGSRRSDHPGRSERGRFRGDRGGIDLNDPAAGATTNVDTDYKFKTSNL
jgi:hypothetical protein